MPTYETLELTEGVATGVANLLYKTFGYTHSDENLYAPKRLVTLVEEGAMRCMVVGDGSGRVVGYFDMRFPFGGTEVATFGVLLIDPDLPEVDHLIVLNLVLKDCLRQVGHAIRNEGLRLLMTTDTTDHNLSQRLSGRFGLTVTGLLFGTVPAGGHRFHGAYRPKGAVPDRHGAVSGHRRAEVLSVYSPRQVLESYETCLSPRYEWLTTPLYEAMDLPVTFVPPVAPQGATEWRETLQVHRGIATIEVTHLGSDAPDVLRERVRHYRDGFVPTVHILIPQDPADPEAAFYALEEDGALFGGLVPRFKGRDMVMMQVVDAIDPGLTPRQLHDKAAKEILAYARG